MHPVTTADIFVGKIQKTDSCWFWKGHINTLGYGRIGILNKNYAAHRISYQLFKGKIPNGLTLDHLCRVRHCVNPQHLEAVTSAVNTLRGNAPSAINKRKTYCINGHELKGRNIYFYSKEKSYGPFRCCKLCRGVNIDRLNKPCKVEGCNVILKKGTLSLCRKHYKRRWRLEYFRKHGVWE